MIKYFGAKVLHDVIDRAVQIHGALGYSGDMPLESLYRFARHARFVDGADEVHRESVARHLLGNYEGTRGRRAERPCADPSRRGAGEVRGGARHERPRRHRHGSQLRPRRATRPARCSRPAPRPSSPPDAPSAWTRCGRNFPASTPSWCDVTDERRPRAARLRRWLERHGRIDGLVNNAGAGAHGPALKTSVEHFAQVVDLNLTAPFALSCLVAPHMRNGGGKSIVNVASVMGVRSIGEIPDAAYVASKAGMIGLTRELASQWGRYGIRVNAVAPGSSPLR